MVTSYHINKNGQKAVCHATKRACRYTEHFTVAPTGRIVNQQQLVAKMDAYGEELRLDVLVTLPPSALHLPTTYLRNADAIFDYADNPYCPSWSTGSDNDDPYRSPYVEEETPNAEIHSLDRTELLASIYDTHPINISQELEDYAESLGLFSPFNYEKNFRIYQTMKEYEFGVDREAELINPEVYNSLTNWYYNQNNATDPAGVLEYCRGKGYDTTGKTPAEALKAQLKQENNNIKHPRVDRAKNVEFRKLELNRIRIPSQHHWQNVQPASLTPPVAGSKKIAGVVMANEDGSFTLVDGYHRTKKLKQNSHRVYGDYFVLS